MLRNRVSGEKSSRSFDLCAAPIIDFGRFGAASTLHRLLTERSASRMAGDREKRVFHFEIAIYSLVFRVLCESDLASAVGAMEQASCIARTSLGSSGKKIRKVVDTKKMRG